MASTFLSRIQSHIRVRSVQVDECDEVDGLAVVLDVLKEIELLLNCMDEFVRLWGCTEDFLEILLRCVEMRKK